MRVGVDASCWTNARGYGRYARELLRAMVARGGPETFEFFVPEPDRAAFDLDGGNVRVIAVPQTEAPARAASATGSRSLGDMLRLTRAVRRVKPEAFFSPSVYTYFPLPPGQRALIAVHDTIAERYPALTLPSPRARLFWRLKVGLALRQADLILTVSDYAARDITRVLGVGSSRLRVSGEAPAPAFRPGTPDEAVAAAERMGVPRGAAWFTYVGGFNPHKRLDVVVEAHRRLAAAHPADPPHLVLAGSIGADVFHRDLGELRRAIADGGTEPLVHWPGFVPDEELRHLHSGAVALVLVSECEGFGLPAVEAAACGTPVIATVESPLPDLLQGGGIFVVPGDVEQTFQAMRRLFDDAAERRRLGALARKRAELLSWERSADVVLDALREVAA